MNIKSDTMPVRRTPIIDINTGKVIRGLKRRERKLKLNQKRFTEYEENEGNQYGPIDAIEFTDDEANIIIYWSDATVTRNRIDFDEFLNLLRRGEEQIIERGYSYNR